MAIAVSVGMDGPSTWMASVRHLDQVSLSIDTKEVGSLRVVVGHWDLSKELEVDGQLAIVIAGPLVLFVLEQPRWNGNNQLHLDFTGIVQEEHFRSQEHDLPHGHELTSTSTEMSKEATSVYQRIGKAEEAMKEEHSIKERP
jgi:hypothetical protein